MQPSDLRLGKFEFRDSFKASTFMFLISGIFCAMFFMIRLLGLHEVFKICGTSIVECDCRLVSEGALYGVRLVAMWGAPVALFGVFPCFYYQGIPMGSTILSCGLVCISSFTAAIIARRYPLPAQIVVFSIQAVLYVNCFFYAMDGIRGMRLILHMTIVLSWGAAVCATEYAISGIDPQYYPYILPLFTAACEASIIRGMNLVQDSDVSAAVSLLCPCLGIVLGINFNAYITASDIKELAITCAMSSAFEFLFKMKPAYALNTGGTISFGNAMYYKTIVYVEYTPVFAYYALMITNFSPMGQMVESTKHGCSGENLIPEFADRQFAILIMIGSEIFTDFISYLFIQKVWNLGHIIQPLHFDSWLSVACVTFPTVWGAMCALEASSVIFKFAIRDGIV